VTDPSSVLLSAMTRHTPVSVKPKAKPKPKAKAPAPVLEGPCDKCDGPHHESQCPYFRNKQRESHHDAQDRYQKKKRRQTQKKENGECEDDDDADIDDDAPVLLSADRVRVVVQPGDGSCLFHSLGNGCRPTRTAGQLRFELEDYIASNPAAAIGSTPIADWVLWDSQCTVGAYATRMKAGNDWGGAIEIAVFAQTKRCEVHVYERSGGGFLRISRFLPDDQLSSTSTSASTSASTVVSVVYGGRCHYDSLILK